ncbi:Os07g0124400, partial [Oryza sativa Japonica Group]
EFGCLPVHGSTVPKAGHRRLGWISVSFRFESSRDEIRWRLEPSSVGFPVGYWVTLASKFSSIFKFLGFAAFCLFGSCAIDLGDGLVVVQ